jgi:PAS domain S-box-containing protein
MTVHPTSDPEPRGPESVQDAPQAPDHHRLFLDDLTEWVGRFRPDGTFHYVNEAYCRFFGKTEAELVGQRWQPVVVPEDVHLVEARLRQLSPANPVVVIENRVIGGDGAVYWGEFVNRAFYNPRGQLITMQSVGRDITERKQHEMKYQQMAREQGAILDSPIVGIFKVSRRVTVWANNAFAHMLGCTVEEVVGQPSRTWYASNADYDRFGRDAFPVVFRGETFRTELQQRSKDGSVGWYEFAVRMLNPDTATLIGTMVNITARKTAEAALAGYLETLESKVATRTAELIEARDAADAATLQATLAQEHAEANLAQLRASLSAMDDAVFISDHEGRFIHFNAAFARFHQFVNVDECAKSVQEFTTLVDVYLPNGELLPLDQWAVPRALRGESAVNAEYTLRRRDTGATWIGSYNFAPVRDAQGRIIGSVVTGRDITDQKNTQIKLQQALNAADAGLRAKSTFLSTMNHEMRTPMNAIVGMGDLLRRQTTDTQQIRQLDVIKAASTRLLTLIDSLLELARIRSGNWMLEDRPFELQGLLTQTLALTRARIGTKPLSVDLAVDETVHKLRLLGDADRLNQVLLNLSDNAIKFSEQGVIRVVCKLQGEGPDGVDLRFEVQDPGCGIPTGDQSRIFLLEQADGSLTRSHGGSGLGLAISKGLVDMMGGTIGVASAPGSGSVFWFTLRLRRAQATC